MSDRKLSVLLGSDAQLQAELSEIIELRIARERKKLGHQHARAIETLQVRHAEVVSQLRMEIVKLKVRLKDRGLLGRLFRSADEPRPHDEGGHHAADRHDPETQ